MIFFSQFSFHDENMRLGKNFFLLKRVSLLPNVNLFDNFLSDRQSNDGRVERTEEGSESHGSFACGGCDDWSRSCRYFECHFNVLLLK